MKKKILISIICALTILSIATLLLVFLLPTKSETDDFNLKLECEDVIVYVDESASIVYSVNFPLAKVTFSIADNTIAKIENKKVIGIRQGETTMEVVASLNKKSMTKTVKIVVKDENFSFVIKPTSSCENDDLTLTYSSPASFAFELYDKKGKLIINPKYNIIASDGIIFRIEFSNLLILSSSNGYIKFSFKDIDFSVTVNLMYQSP